MGKMIIFSGNGPNSTTLRIAPETVVVYHVAAAPVKVRYFPAENIQNIIKIKVGVT